MLQTETYIDFSHINLSTDDICRIMGYGEVEAMKDISDIVERMLFDISKIASPCFHYQIKEGHVDAGVLSIEGTGFQVGRIIGKQLVGSTHFACFLATAGERFNQYLEQLKNENDMLNIYIADLIGSEIAERTCDYMEQVLDVEIHRSGWKHTNRYSPGYCGWDVAQQKKLFELFPSGACGVSLTASNLMLPIKSVSGVIGVGTNVSRKEYTCELCGYRNCYKRKKKNETIT